MQEVADTNSSARKGPLYKQSPFYEDFIEKEEQIKSKIESHVHNINAPTCKNDFYNKNLAEFILKNYIHVLPLWTGITSLPGVTYSNAVAENWFGLVKTNILNGELRIKLNRFLTAIGTHVETLPKKVTPNFGSKRLATAYSSKPRPFKHNTEARDQTNRASPNVQSNLQPAVEAYNPGTEEMWSRKRKGSGTYLHIAKLRKT